MAETMQFDLVSPERSLASLQARSVLIPGSEGDMTAMPDHAPTITTLRPGVVRVEGAEGEASYVVSGGFAEVGADSISVLADRAVPIGDADSTLMEEFIGSAREALETAKSRQVGVDEATKRLADMEALASSLHSLG